MAAIKYIGRQSIQLLFCCVFVLLCFCFVVFCFVVFLFCCVFVLLYFCFVVFLFCCVFVLFCRAVAPSLYCVAMETHALALSCYFQSVITHVALVIATVYPCFHGNYKFIVLCQQPRLQTCVCSISKDYSVAILSTSERRCLLVAACHSAPVTTIRWRLEDDFILVGCMDGKLFVWQIETGL